MNYDVDGENVFNVNVGLSLNAIDGSDIVVKDSICGHTLVMDDKIKVFNCAYDQYDFYDITYLGLQLTSFTWDGVDQKLIESFTIPANTGFTYTLGSDDNAMLTVSGQVAPSGTQTQTFKCTDDDFMFILKNPFPIATTLAEINGFATEMDDKVKVYNPEYDQDDFYDRTFLGWQKTTFTWDGADQAVIPEKDYESTVVIPAGQFGTFTPGDTDKEYVWSVTFNY